MKVQTLFLFPSTWNQRKEQISRLPSLTSIFEGQPLQTNTEISHQNQWVIKYFQVPGNQLETPKTQVYFQLPPKKMLANSYGFQFIKKKTSLLVKPETKKRQHDHRSISQVAMRRLQNLEKNHESNGGWWMVVLERLDPMVSRERLNPTSPPPLTYPPTRNSRPKLRVYLLTIGFP